MISEQELQEIIDAHDTLVKGIHRRATTNTDGRAYGGIIRAGKGKLVESIAKQLILLAWKDLGQDEHRLEINLFFYLCFSVFIGGLFFCFI